MIVEGQLHGALAQGLGQALMEQIFYDEGSGQLVTGSFQDYAMPRAADMPPDIRDALHNVPATTNPLGVKGVGEAGTTASIAAVMNAVADALPGGAGAHLDMPVTAARLWEACRRAKAKTDCHVRRPERSSTNAHAGFRSSSDCSRLPLAPAAPARSCRGIPRGRNSRVDVRAGDDAVNQR